MSDGFYVFLVILLALIVIFMPIIRNFWHLIQLHRFGRSLKAEIVDRQRAQAFPNLVSIHYRFEVNGGTWAAEYYRDQRVTGTTYQKLKHATEVEIKYLPTDPTISRLAGQDVDYAAFLEALLWGTLIALTMCIFVFICALVSRPMY